MNSAFKVGLITILTIGTTLFAMIFIWQINPYSKYSLKGYFPHVGGIKVGSAVTLMGVQIGEVVDVVPEPAKKRVLLTMTIDKGIQLPVSSTFTIVTTGLVGDKNVEILPPEKPQEAFLKPGAEVTGIPPASLDAIFTEAQEMLKSARSLVEDKALREDIRNTIHMVSQASTQMNDLFKEIKGAAKGFGRITTQTELMLKQINFATQATIPEFQAIIGSVRRIALNTEQFSGRLNEIAGDQEIFSDTKSTVQNIRNLTKKWNDLSEDLGTLVGPSQKILENTQGITQDIRDITSDKEIQSNLKTVARNASRLTNTFLNLSDPNQGKQDEMDIDIRTEALGIAGLGSDFKVTPGAQVNFNVFGKLGLDIPLSYFRVGLDSIGDSNLINLQAGSDIGEGTGTLRFGLVRGRIGAGTDLHLQFLEQPLTISGELYDINSPHMRLGLLQNIYEDYGLSLYWDNQFLRGINEFSLGLRWQPGSKKPSDKNNTLQAP